jgi:hypothetical protein
LFIFVFLPIVFIKAYNMVSTPKKHGSTSSSGAKVVRTAPPSENVVYAKGKTSVRSAPEVGAPVVRKTQDGEVMLVFARQGEWLKISPSRSEWIYSEVVTTERPTPREATPTPGPKRRKNANDGWINPGGHIWTGLNIYVGTESGEKTFIGSVIGGNSDEVEILYASGRIGWQDRKAMVRGNTFWCRADDPAIEDERWMVLKR